MSESTFDIINGDRPAPDDPGNYATIAEAEAAITGAGYVRDNGRSIWVHRDTGKTAKVVRAVDNQNSLRFSVQRA